MAEHTPLPWSCGSQWIFTSTGCPLPIASGYQPFVTDPGGREHEKAVANAALIVRAVNSHDALVEALKVCVDLMVIMGHVYNASDAPALELTLDKARAALASAQSVEGK